MRLGGDTRRSAQVRLTVGEVVAGHLASVEGKWSPTTHDDLTRVNKRLPVVFTNRRVRDIRPATLAALYDQLLDEGWSANRVRKVHTLLSVSLKSAVVHGHLTTNPCREVSPPTVEPTNVHAPESDDVRAVLDAVDGSFRTFLQLAVITGCRRGELVAVQWDDIDWQHCTISFSRSLAQKIGAPAVVRGTKTGAKGHRKLDVPEAMMMALAERYEAMSDLASGRQLPAPVWVFSDDAGVTPWRPDRPSRMFRKACETAGIDGVRLHDVRHYVATTMLQDGEEPIDVAGQLGHSTVATTLKTYASYMPGRGREAAERRAKRLGLG